MGIDKLEFHENLGGYYFTVNLDITFSLKLFTKKREMPFQRLQLQKIS
jgi:hypothetical protein